MVSFQLQEVSHVFSRFSFATDVARGMSYLHQHRICHGRLKSLNCVLDDRWVCKITGRFTSASNGIWLQHAVCPMGSWEVPTCIIMQKESVGH